MIKFFLDPPSGHADSYTDVQFVVEFDKAERAEIKIFNQSNEEQLEILSVNSGRIIDENIAVSKNVSSIEGHINVFNRDKMNVGLKNFVSVDIRCEAHLTRGGETVVEKEVFVFYNESKSLDSEIIPFDLEFHDKTVDIPNQIPLRMTVVSDVEKRYELCIRSQDSKHKCTFEITTQVGSTLVEIPATVLYSDLSLKSSNIHPFHVYWVKFEGVDYQKFMNRKYVKLPDSRLFFKRGPVNLQAQKRAGPTGKPLPQSFILSDRYLVHTWKEFSAFNKKTSHNMIKMRRLSAFLHEAQGMQAVVQSIQTFGTKEQTSPEFSHALRQNTLSPKRKAKRIGIQKEKSFFETHSKVYTKKSVDHLLTDPGRSIRSFSHPAKAGGCGCSRKK